MPSTHARVRAASLKGPAPPIYRRTFVPEPNQAAFLDDVFDGSQGNIMGFGGAIRGGKTIAVLHALFLLCRMYPGSRWAIVRKDLPRIRRNTIPTIERFAPRPFFGRLDKSEWKYRCANGSELLVLGEQLSTDPDLDRFKGLEVNGFALEEANEIDEKTANKCKERAGSWIIQPTSEYLDPVQPPALLLCTFNPADNWVREWFYDPWREGRIRAPYYFRPALPKDNRYNTEQQWEMWRQLPPVEYQRFIEGDWSAIVDPYQLITYQQIMACATVQQRRASFGHGGRVKLGIDVATSAVGDDTVFVVLDGNVLDGNEIEVHRGWDELTTASRAEQYINGEVLDVPVAASDVIVDSLPPGVVNLLRRMGRAVKAFVAGAAFVKRTLRPKGPPVRNKATGVVSEQAPVLSTAAFNNLRSQAWYEFAQKVRKEELVIINPTKELIRDLTAPRYDFSHGELKIVVDDRETIIERTGHSPDVGTAAIQAAFDFPPPPVVRSAGTMTRFTG
jgi:hypothetical protein